MSILPIRTIPLYGFIGHRLAEWLIDREQNNGYNIYYIIFEEFPRGEIWSK